MSGAELKKEDTLEEESGLEILEPTVLVLEKVASCYLVNLNFSKYSFHSRASLRIFKLCFPAHFQFFIISGYWSNCSLLQPHRILQALRRYVRAENKDRLHTIRHYQHVLAVDPEKAAQMKSQVP